MYTLYSAHITQLHTQACINMHECEHMFTHNVCNMCINAKIYMYMYVHCTCTHMYAQTPYIHTLTHAQYTKPNMCTHIHTDMHTHMTKENTSSIVRMYVCTYDAHSPLLTGIPVIPCSPFIPSSP